MTLPTLWLYGTAGVGKTTAAWELFTALPEPVGLVDIDQLGMCYGPPTPGDVAPEPAYDPGRFRLKARNLDAVAANFRAFGAACLIVPGVVDPATGPSSSANAAVTAVRLRAEPDHLAKRIAHRGRPTDEPAALAEVAEALDRLPGPCVDTTGRGVPEVVALVRAAVAPWPATSPDPRAVAVAASPWPESAPPSPAPSPSGRPVLSPSRPGRRPSPPGSEPSSPAGEIVWICGPAAVGKSSVGWAVYMRSLGAGTRTAFADLDQIGFHRPVTAGNHRLKAANAASLWQAYAAEGARRLVLVGPATAAAVAVYRAALPAARMTICRLRATPATLTARAHARGRGESPARGLAGDLLAGAPAAILDRVAAGAAAHAAELERANVGDFALDTDGRTPADLADEILARIPA